MGPTLAHTDFHFRISVVLNPFQSALQPEHQRHHNHLVTHHHFVLGTILIVSQSNHFSSSLKEIPYVCFFRS